MPAWNSTRVIRFSRRERERDSGFEKMSGNSVHVDSIFRRTGIRILERIISGIIRRMDLSFDERVNFQFGKF